MTQDLNQNIQKLTHLLEQSQNKKLLWEEMQLISARAFDLQDAIMAELDRVEATETDITKIQAAFAARESIWDIMNKIAARELELHEKTHRKETPAERAERHRAVREEACSCKHHGDKCCQGHHHDSCTGGTCSCHKK